MQKCENLSFNYHQIPTLQYSLRESSNFQPSCVNISFFPSNKASKLAWILRGTCRGSRGKFSRETRGWSRVMHEVCCIYLKIDLFKKIWRMKLPMPLCCGKILHVSRMKSGIFRTFTRIMHAQEN